VTTKWLTLEEAMAHLRVRRERLRAAIRAGAHAAWVNIGTGAMPRYRFDAALIDEWWRETCRASAPTTGDTKSAGQTRTAHAARVRSLRNELRTHSHPKSKSPRASDAAGSLVTLVRNGPSTTA
jgi:histidine ammonia-lyase